jgi:aminopeptidase N
MKKKLINILFLCFLIVSCGNPRPHGGNEIPPLTRNNYLMGFLNEYRSSYDVTYYDINIDFNIEEKSLDGFVTIKSKSLKDIDTLQVDLAKNLEIKKITYENNEIE